MKVPPELVLNSELPLFFKYDSSVWTSQLGKEEQEPLLVCVCVLHTQVCNCVTHTWRGQSRMSPIALHAAALTPGLSLNQKFTVFI